VHLFNNRITDKGLREITAKQVQNLNLSQNHISDDGAEYIAKLPSLINVNLTSNQIGDKGVQALRDAKKLVILDITQNVVTAKGFLEICKNKTIKILQLFNNNVQFVEADVVPHNDTLTTLGLASNRLDGKCAKVLEGLVSIPSLKELDLSGNAIDDSAATVLFKYKSHKLKIDLNGNPISATTLKKSLD
jgi:Leucine-rich repeat (LRR) protein